jgi:hypothetical protein
VPDAAGYDDQASAPYHIVLDERRTTQIGPDNWGFVGTTYFFPDHRRTAVGDRYIVLCNVPERRTIAYYCAAQLRWADGATVHFNQEPQTADTALKMIHAAELYLSTAEGL